jgi:hypothetical protein
MGNDNVNSQDKPLDLKQYLDAFSDSSSRGRYLLTLLILTSFITLLAWFNTLAEESNWFLSRIKSLKTTSPWLKFPDDQKALPGDSIYNTVVYNGNLRANDFSISEIVEIIEDHSNFKLESGTELERDIQTNTSRAKIPSYYIKISDHTFRIDSINDASPLVHLLAANSYSSRWEINRFIQVLYKERVTGALLIDVPFLGLSFDVNSLCLISGIAFSIIYFLLFYSLWRERKNLTLIFAISDLSKIQLYQLVSMRQVFTIPPSVDETINSKVEVPIKNKNSVWHFFLRHLPVIPMIFPAVVWGIVFVHDVWYTGNVGARLNPEYQTTENWIALIFGFSAIILFFLCTSQWNKSNNVWANEANKIIEIHNRLITEGNASVEPKADDQQK